MFVFKFQGMRDLFYARPRKVQALFCFKDNALLYKLRRRLSKILFAALCQGIGR